MVADLPSSVLIAAMDIGLRRGGNSILTGINLEISAKEIVSLIGPNGAGKTSLVKVLLGLELATTGQVKKRSGVRIGYVPQRLPLDPILPLSVNRFVTLTSRRNKETVLATLQETGVRHLVDAPVQSLSGGELQRVLLARALLQNPDLLVLDEPVQGVDFAGEADMYRLIENIRHQRGCGILLVSHDLHVVLGATDRVVCLNQHICCAGTPEIVSEHPEFARLFGAKAGKIYAVYSHEHTHGHTLSGEVVNLEKKDNLSQSSSHSEFCQHDH